MTIEMVFISVCLAVATLFLIFAFQPNPVVFVPTPEESVAAMIKLARPRPGELWIDLGSGDGRVVIAAAKAGATAIGYEIDRRLIEESRRRVLECGLQGRAEIRKGDFWAVDLSEADVVSAFLFDTVMKRFQEKLRSELKPGCRIISVAFSLPDWEPKERH